MPDSVIAGNIGVSPIASTAITGFSLTTGASSVFSTSTQVVGKVYAPDYTGTTSPTTLSGTTPATLTVAVLDMEAAYTDASSRAITGTAATNLNVNAGLIGGATFTEGVYEWGSDVNFASTIYILGNPDSRYIFKSTSNVVAGSDAKVTLNL